MSLVDRLEKLAKELDQQRWRNGAYDADKANQSDLVAEAAKMLRGSTVICPPISDSDCAQLRQMGHITTWLT